MSEEPKPVKLPYFHRTLSPEELALIGDTTPKPIETQTTTPVVNNSVGTTSAWNSANTWEERNCTSWAKDTISDIYNEVINGSTPVGTGVLSGIDSVEGHANITHVRGRARFLYEFSFKLTVVANDSTVEASVSDVISDCIDDIEYSYKFTGTALDRSSQDALKKAIKALVVQKTTLFEEKFRAHGSR